MIQPHRSQVEYLRKDADMLIARVQHFDVTMANNAAMCPTAGYTVGSIQCFDEKTALSTGVITASVSNDPECDTIVAHPTATTLSAAGATQGLALEHAYFGAQVTSIQGTAAGESVCVILWIVLKK